MVGDLVPGRVYIVIAPTGTGKTTFTTNMTYDFMGYEEAKGTPFQTMLFPTEESLRFHKFLACRHLGISYKHYVNGMLDEDRQRIRLQAKVFQADTGLDVHRSINLYS